MIQQTDADDRQADIAGRFQKITRQNAKPAGIERQRLTEAELHAEIGDPRQGDSAVGRCEPAGCPEILLPRPGEPFELGGERAIGGKRPQPFG